MILVTSLSWENGTEMTVSADPKICLSFLYQNDPFYSLCLSDLLTAPQRVKNKFLKEQKNLTVTIKRLECQKLSRLRQLNEENKQFRLLMIKKLAPRVTVSRETAERRIGTERLCNVPFSSLPSRATSWKSLDPKFSARPNARIFSAEGCELPATHPPKFCKVSLEPKENWGFEMWHPRQVNSVIERKRASNGST
ncbi:Succinate--CoA ligase [ADP-forming] subunit beta [Varanus komodoensis]|nr:Succinate--CoA ligase [ADP-forming] subunit beta [Varanus komodoensis]